MKLSRKLTALALLPAALLLAACETTTTMEIHEDGKLTMDAQIVDTQGLLAMSGLSCDQLKSQMNLSGNEDMEVDVVDNTKDGKLDCTVQAKSVESAVDGRVLKETDDTYVLTVDGSDFGGGVSQDDLKQMTDMGLKFTLNVVMPGDIVSAEGGKISGNQATFDDLNTIAGGIVVEGKKTASANSSGASAVSDGAATNTGASSSSSNTTWILVGVAVVALLAIGAVLLTRKKKSAAPVDYSVFSAPEPAPASETPKSDGSDYNPFGTPQN